MKIEPLPPRRRKAPPVALVVPGHRAVTILSDDGERTARGPKRCRDLLTTYERHRLFCDAGLSNLRHTTGALSWTASTWRGRITSMYLDGTKVHVTSLRGVLGESGDPWADLCVALDWADSLGVAPAAPTTMAWNLWRSTLSAPVTVWADPEVGRRALFGGRQEISRPGTYKHMASNDIVAAYPHSMSVRPYALSLAEVHRATTLDPSVAGLARARVAVPIDLPYPPLPVRLARDLIQWQWGFVEGTWAWCELAAARAIGCAVDVLKCWAPARESDLFSRWWSLIEPGRRLPGTAARFVKMLGNCLWGIFGMAQTDRTLIAWKNDAGTSTYTIRAENRDNPHRAMAHVASETTARVRTRLLNEGLYSDAAAPVHIDTDGIIVRKSAALPEPHGDAAGEWRTKQTMLRVEIRAPQLYRWFCVLCGVSHAEGHYVAAGSPPDAARMLFAQVPRGRLQLSWRPDFDTVVPPGHSDEPMVRL